MLEKDIKEWLKPIHNSIERVVPTNRTLIDFVNEKALGNGIKRSLYKVKFIDKSEKSTYKCVNVALNEFKRHLKDRKVSDEDSEVLIARATEVLEEAKSQVEKVYGEVRRYVVTSELRTGCVQHHFKKIPLMNEKQNEAMSKEIFSMAMDIVNKSDKHSIDDVEEEFEKINKIAISLFELAQKTGVIPNANDKKTTKRAESKSNSPFSLLENLW